MKVFISYTRRDPDKRSLRFGGKLAKFLCSHGVDVIFDELSFTYGRPLIDQILEGVNNSDRMILIATPSSLKSKYVQTEILYARDKAINIHPVVYLHVVSFSRQSDVSFLPNEFKAYLYHSASGKTESSLLYEILFSIHGVEIGYLTQQQLALNHQSNWLILKRQIKIEILNKEGDALLETFYSAKNISDSNQNETFFSHAWSEGYGCPKMINFKGYLGTNKKLKIIKKYSYYRGKKATNVSFFLPRAVHPEGIIEYKTVYLWKSAFNLLSGDIYMLDTEQNIYGYLQWDIIFPLTVISSNPTMKIILPNKRNKIIHLEMIARNKYRYVLMLPPKGATYKIHLHSISSKNAGTNIRNKN